eukprot:SAG22_NODE_96_length_20771_cov_33.186018_2_plen_245_part_00
MTTAIGPAACKLTAYKTLPVDGGGSQLLMTLTHAPTTLQFHIVAALGAGDAGPSAGALNLSIKVELSAAAGAEAEAAARAQNITLAFPYVSGIAIGKNGSTNAGINHFSTGLATDGTLPAWTPSGGLYGAHDGRTSAVCSNTQSTQSYFLICAGWHIAQSWSTVWEPSSGDGLAMIVQDTAVLDDTDRQRVIMRYPGADPVTPGPAAFAPPSGGMYALAFPATQLGGGECMTNPARHQNGGHQI